MDIARDSRPIIRRSTDRPKNLLPLPPDALETRSPLTAAGASAPCLSPFSSLVSKRTFLRSPAYLGSPLRIAAGGSDDADAAGEVEAEDPKDAQVPAAGGSLCCGLASRRKGFAALSVAGNADGFLLGFKLRLMAPDEPGGK